MEKRHQQEIIRWAKAPKGTKIWYKQEGDAKWYITEGTKWYEDTQYIVDDKWAELRKAQADGKQLQWINEGEFVDVTLKNSPTGLIKYWRIKPEPVYEWQWIIRRANNTFALTVHKTEHEMKLGYEKFEPSKRIRHA